MAGINRSLHHQTLRQNEADSKDRMKNSALADKEAALDIQRRKIEYMVRVLWECMAEMGVTRDEIDRKMQEIEERGWTINPDGYYRLCPKCGRKVYDYTEKTFDATCMYCGLAVPMYPGDAS